MSVPWSALPADSPWWMALDVLVCVALATGVALAALDSEYYTRPVQHQDLAVYLAAGRAWRDGVDPSVTANLALYAHAPLGGRFLYPSWSLPLFSALGRLDDESATALWKSLQLMGLSVSTAGWYAVARPAGIVRAAAGVTAAVAFLWPMVPAGFLNGNVLFLEAGLVPWALVFARGRGRVLPALAGVLLTLSGTLKMQGLSYLPSIARRGATVSVLLGIACALVAAGLFQGVWPQAWWMYRLEDFTHLWPQDWFNDSGFQAVRAALGTGASGTAVWLAYGLLCVVALAPFLPALWRGRREDHWIAVAWLAAAFLVLPRRHVYDWAVLPGIAGALVALQPRAAWILVPGWMWAPSQEGLGPWWVGLCTWAGAVQAAVLWHLRGGVPPCAPAGNLLTSRCEGGR